MMVYKYLYMQTSPLPGVQLSKLTLKTIKLAIELS